MLTQKEIFDLVHYEQDIFRKEMLELVTKEVTRVLAERRKRTRKNYYVKKVGPRKRSAHNYLMHMSAKSFVEMAEAAIMQEVATVGSITATRAREITRKRNASLRALDRLLKQGKLVRLAGVYTAPSTPAPAIE